jgi:hypothetical protein
MAESDYGGILSKSLKFGFHAKRWLPLFVVGLLFSLFSTMLSYQAINNLPSDLTMLNQVSAEAIAYGVNMLWMGIISFVVLVVYIIVTILILGAIIQQSYKEKESISSTYRFSMKRFPSLLVLSILETVIALAVIGVAALIMFGLSIIGLAGLILGLIILVGSVVFLGLSLMFSQYALIISGRSVIDSIRESYAIFRQRPWSVLAAAILLLIVCGLISLVFYIPYIAYTFSIVLQNLTVFTSLGSVDVQMLMYDNMPLLIAVNAIAMLGYSIVVCIATKGLAEFYLAWRKKKLL